MEVIRSSSTSLAEIIFIGDPIFLVTCNKVPTGRDSIFFFNPRSKNPISLLLLYASIRSSDNSNSTITDSFGNSISLIDLVKQ